MATLTPHHRRNYGTDGAVCRQIQLDTTEERLVLLLEELLLLLKSRGTDAASDMYACNELTPCIPFPARKYNLFIAY